MSKGRGSSQPASTTSTNTTSPWAGASQYLSNNNTTFNPATRRYEPNDSPFTPGAYEMGANYVQDFGQLNPEQNSIISGQQANLNGRSAQLQNTQNDIYGLGRSIAGGAYSTDINPVANAAFSSHNAGGVAPPVYNDISASNTPTYNNVNASNSNIQNARTTQGVLDPTRAMQQMLAGDPTNNPFLGQMNQANINDSMRGYGDMLQQLNQQVMPGINNDAIANGQMGSSRQGIAQGMALQQAEKNARDLTIHNTDAGNQLYGSAFENAQGRMAGTASALNSQALQNDQFNTGINNDTARFNATNRLQNDQFNTGINNDTARFNATNRLQNDQLIAQASLQNNQFNAGNLNSTDQFLAQLNANTDFQNNSQAMQQNAQNLQNSRQGVSMANEAQTNLFSGQDQIYQQLMQLSQLPQAQQQNALDFYANMLNPGAHSGGSSVSTNPYFQGSTAGQIGGMLAGGAGLLGSLRGG